MSMIGPVCAQTISVTTSTALIFILWNFTMVAGAWAMPATSMIVAGWVDGHVLGQALGLISVATKVREQPPVDDWLAHVHPWRPPTSSHPLPPDVRFSHMQITPSAVYLVYGAILGDETIASSEHKNSSLALLSSLPTHVIKADPEDAESGVTLPPSLPPCGLAWRVVRAHLLACSSPCKPLSCISPTP